MEFARLGFTDKLMIQDDQNVVTVGDIFKSIKKYPLGIVLFKIKTSLKAKKRKYFQMNFHGICWYIIPMVM